MLIVCPTCATTYQIKLAALGEAGRTVRCASCKNTWFATPDSAIMEAETALVPVAAAGSRAAAGRLRRTPPATDDLPTTVGDFAVETITPSDEQAGDTPVIDAPPLAPQRPRGRSRPKFEPGEPENIETIAARRARQK